MAIKQEVRNALYDVFTPHAFTSDILKQYGADIRLAVDEFKASMLTQETASAYNALDVVLMLMAWLMVEPNQDKLVESFVETHKLIGKLYGGLRQIFVAKSSKFNVYPCFSSNVSHRFLKNRLDGQIPDAYYLMFRHKYLFGLVAILHSLDMDNYEKLIAHDRSYWLILYHFKAFHESPSNDILVDTLLQSNDYIQASIAFYYITQKHIGLAHTYADCIRRDRDSMLLRQDLPTTEDAAYRFTNAYDDLYTRLKSLMTDHLSEIILYHIFDINRSFSNIGAFILPIGISLLVNSYSNLFDIVRLSHINLYDLSILVRCLNVLDTEKAMDCSHQYAICPEIILNLIKNGVLCIIDDVSDLNWHKNDTYYMDTILKGLPVNVKEQLEDKLCAYRLTLFASPLDRMVRHTLYLRDYRKYETASYIISCIKNDECRQDI